MGAWGGGKGLWVLVVVAVVAAGEAVTTAVEEEEEALVLVVLPSPVQSRQPVGDGHHLR